MEEVEVPIPDLLKKLINTHNYYIDKTTLYLKTRWFSLLGLFIVYVLRVYYVTGFYVVSYALSIFLLNLFLRFLTPHNIEEIYEQYENENNGLLLPMKQTNEQKRDNNPDDKKEFRPFLRKLNEFKFWNKLKIWSDLNIYPLTHLPSKLMVPSFGGVDETNKVKYPMNIII
ncbi:hypothetical protein YYG_04037 [Plasmodium vinckei petteri]|uniref:Protein RER1 n=1 Tax=Plasmodium vinckei petteri TaxID=138298 RepID=W7AI32_PLAVN|nr:hypothetical protein YYG_04037 [Plasmodium vinckei petteri]